MYMTDKTLNAAEIAAACDDDVERPAHYRQGEVECIAAIRAALTPEEYRGYLKGNIIKYTWRERMNGGLQSVRKALWYVKRLVEVSE